MSEIDRAGLLEPAPSSLPTRAAGVTWQRAKDDLTVPERGPVEPGPGQLTPARARATLCRLSLRGRHPRVTES